MGQSVVDWCKEEQSDVATLEWSGHVRRLRLKMMLNNLPQRIGDGRFTPLPSQKETFVNGEMQKTMHII
jgi:hypothetical protein